MHKNIYIYFLLLFWKISSGFRGGFSCINTHAEDKHLTEISISLVAPENLTSNLLQWFGKHAEALKSQLNLVKLPASHVWINNTGLKVRDTFIIFLSMSTLIACIKSTFRWPGALGMRPVHQERETLQDKNKNISSLPPQLSKCADFSKKHPRRKSAFLQLRQQEVGCCQSHAALLYMAPVHVGETGNVITPDRKTNLFPRNLALKRIDRPQHYFCAVLICVHTRGQAINPAPE